MKSLFSVGTFNFHLDVESCSTDPTDHLCNLFLTESILQSRNKKRQDKTIHDTKRNEKNHEIRHEIRNEIRNEIRIYQTISLMTMYPDNFDAMVDACG